MNSSNFIGLAASLQQRVIAQMKIKEEHDVEVLLSHPQLTSKLKVIGKKKTIIFEPRLMTVSVVFEHFSFHFVVIIESLIIFIFIRNIINKSIDGLNSGWAC